MTDLSNESNRPVNGASEELSRVAGSLALALGLTRMLTRLPLYDRSLDEIENLLGDAWGSLVELRRQLDEEQTFWGSR